ncbi:O-antigen ligase family protein [Patescibacteria group bacterium]
MKKLTSILLFSLMIIFPFGQLTRISLGLGVNLYLHDFIITILAIIYIFNKPKFKSFLTKPLIIFISAATLSLVVNLNKFPLSQIFTSSLYLVRFIVYSSLFFIIKDQSKTTKKTLFKLLIYVTTAIGLFGLLQYFLLPDTRFLFFSNWDDHYYRLLSSFLDPNFTGILLVLGLILVFFAQKHWYYYLILLTPLFLTYSRSSYLGLLTAGLAISIIKKKFKYLLAIIVLLIISLPVLPRPGGEGVKLERVFSIKQRAYNYQEGIKIFKTDPIFGIGFNTLRLHRNDFTSHAASGLDSSPLFVLTTTGIVGLIAYLNLLKNIYKISPIVQISLITVLVHSFFQNTLFYPWVMIWLWVLSATEYS